MHIGEVVTATIRANGPSHTRAIQLAVLQREGSWLLYLNGHSIGRFQGQANALQCAREIAEETRREGWAVELLSQQVFGELLALPSSAPTVQ